MSCPHLKHSIINKSNGGSIIASSAYNRREKMFDETENTMKYSHTRADDHVLTKMLLPKNSPASYTDPYSIWNDLNKIESDKIGYKLIIPFQRELSFNQNLELAIELLNDEYVSKGHPVQIDVHRGKNNNYHLHAIAADRRLINGEWENQKTETVYYKRGTVKKLDGRGKVINPDAVILTNTDKVNTPKLKGKKLQYDKNNNIIMEKGWQELQYDSNGKPQLDENGYPVLVDIREPYYIQEDEKEYSTKEIKYSKNGKYLKPQFKKDTVKHSDVSDIGNVLRLRKKWENLQNKYFEKNNILDENGKIFTVDLRSYKEQNKERPADQQLIPTRHVGYGMKSESMLNHNEEAKAHNEIVKEMQKTAKALKAEKEKFARSKNALAAMHQDNIKFYNALNPRQLYINIWTARYNELVKNRKATEEQILQKLDNGNKLNDTARKLTDRNTKRGHASWNRLHRHAQLMNKIQSDILKKSGTIIDVADLAGKKFDTFTNKEIVSFVRARYGYDTATVAADVLEQNHKDNSNAISGREENTPYYPTQNTNTIGLQQSIKVITKNPDLAAVKKEAFATWDKTPEEAPPKSVMNVLDSYYTAEEFYNAKLSGHKWKTVHIDRQYNPDAINRDYNAELKTIAVQEKAEADRRADEEKRKAEEARKEAERLAKEQAEADRRADEEKRKAEEARKEAERLAKEQAEADRRAAEEKRKAEETRKEAERLAKEQAEADQPAAWSREEYDRLSSIAKNDLEAYREAVIKHLSDSEYTAKLNNYNDYKELRDPVDAAYQKWQAIKKEEEEEARRKTEESYFYNYEPNQDRIDYYELRYNQEERIFDVKFKKQFPDFPDGKVPEEPDQADIEHTIRQKYGKRQANLLIKDTANLKFENKEVLLENYKNSAAARNAYWKLKPTDDDPGTGKPAAAKTSTVAPPDHKKGNGRGGNGHEL